LFSAVVAKWHRPFFEDAENPFKTEVVIKLAVGIPSFSTRWNP
jgi:hypothetical protein